MRYLIVLLIFAALVVQVLKPFGIEFTWIDPCWDQRYTRNAYIPEGCG